jgi:hypothetical protein
MPLILKLWANLLYTVTRTKQTRDLRGILVMTPSDRINSQQGSTMYPVVNSVDKAVSLVVSLYYMQSGTVSRRIFPMRLSGG